MILQFDYQINRLMASDTQQAARSHEPSAGKEGGKMHKLRTAEEIKPRMLTVEQACKYTGRGQTSFKKWADEIGAVRRFGRSVRFDRLIIDQALDAMGDGSQADQ